MIKQQEFSDLNIKTKQQFAKYIENIVSNPSDTKNLSNDRVAYWDDKTQTVVIKNPNAIDKEAAFRPRNGKNYFNNLR